MAVSLKLYRIGKKNQPMYRIIAVNKRYKANGKYLDEVGFYNPLTNPATFNINKEKYQYWLSKGAVLSEGLNKLLKNKKI